MTNEKFEKAKLSLLYGLTEDGAKINITPDVADYFDGKCYIDTEMSNRIDVLKFKKEDDGILVEYAGTDLRGVNYIHNSKDEYVSATETEDTFFGYYLKAILTNSFSFLEEISNEQYDQVIALVSAHEATMESNKKYLNFIRSQMTKK